MGEYTTLFYDIISGLTQFYELLTTTINDIVGTNVPFIGDLSLIALMLGSGLTIFVSYTLIAWIIDILP